MPSMLEPVEIPPVGKKNKENANTKIRTTKFECSVFCTKQVRNTHKIKSKCHIKSQKTKLNWIFEQK